jgi:hypothetical protein
MRLPFYIYKLRADGSLHFVEAVRTLDAARERLQRLTELQPGAYVIDNEETGERVFSTRDEGKN